MGAWQSGWGKFDSRLTERMYDASLNGGADDEASNEGGQWAGRMVCRRADVLLFQDSQGFIYGRTVDKGESDREWAALADSVEPPEPDELELEADCL